MPAPVDLPQTGSSPDLLLLLGLVALGAGVVLTRIRRGPRLASTTVRQRVSVNR